MKSTTIAAAVAALLLASCDSSEEAAAPAAEDAAAPAATEEAAPETPAAADEAGVRQVSFSLRNDTSQVLTHLYISPAEQDSWNQDILGDQVVQPGAEGTVNIDDQVESCMYDFRADFQNGQSLDVRGVNVCEIEGRTVTVSE